MKITTFIISKLMTFQDTFLTLTSLTNFFLTSLKKKIKQKVRQIKARVCSSYVMETEVVIQTRKRNWIRSRQTNKPSPLIIFWSSHFAAWFSLLSCLLCSYPTFFFSSFENPFSFCSLILVKRMSLSLQKRGRSGWNGPGWFD